MELKDLSILDVVCEEAELIYWDKHGFFREGSRSKCDWPKALGGKDRWVEYLDKYGKKVGSARENIKYFPMRKIVQFYDRNNNEIMYAEVSEKNKDKDLFLIVYYNERGDKIASRYADVEAIRRNNPHIVELEDARKREKETPPAKTPPRGSGGTGPMPAAGIPLGCIVGILIAFVAVFLILGDLIGGFVTSLYYKYHTIFRVTRFACVYLLCPAVLLTGILCTSNIGKGVPLKGSKLIQILLCVPAMLTTSYVLSHVLRSWGDTTSGWPGLRLYMMGYVPLAAYAFVSRLLHVERRKKTQIYGECYDIAKRFVNVAVIMGTVAIFLARMTILFRLKYMDALPVYFFIRTFWHMLVAIFFGLTAKFFFGDYYD